jgi:hypothetical protein
MLIVDVVQRPPHGFAEVDRIAAPNALQNRQALVTRNANGEQSLISGTRLLGAEPRLRREYEAGGHLPHHEAGDLEGRALTLFVFVGIEPGEDEEGALGGVDAPSRHHLVAVLDDAPRCGKLFEHDRGKRQVRQPSNFTSCSHSGPVGGAFARTGAEGIMKGDLRSTDWARLGAHQVRQGHPQPLDRFDTGLPVSQPRVMSRLHAEPHGSRCAERAL